MNTLTMIPFHEDILVGTYGPDDEPMMPIAQFCTRLGVSYQGQIRKLKARESLWGVNIMLTPSANGTQETACLPLRRLAFWLASINPGKVKPELRDPLERYQAECADVLYRHFFGPKEANPEPGRPKPPAWVMVEGLAYGQLCADAALGREAMRRRERSSRSRSMRLATAEQRQIMANEWRKGTPLETIAALTGIEINDLRSVITMTILHEEATAAATAGLAKKKETCGNA
jgi:hypothetical protein